MFQDFKFLSYGNYTGSKLHPNTLPQVSLFPGSFYLFIYFWPQHDVVCRILVPGPAINKPASPAMETWHLNHWTTREVPFLLLFSESIYLFGCARTRLEHVGSWVVAHGIQYPDQGSHPGPLLWEHRALVTGPPGRCLSPYSLRKSLFPILNKCHGKSPQNCLMNDSSFGEHVLQQHVCYFSVEISELCVLNIPGLHWASECPKVGLQPRLGQSETHRILTLAEALAES